jgi:hypothetical protein
MFGLKTRSSGFAGPNPSMDALGGDCSLLDGCDYDQYAQDWYIINTKQGLSIKSVLSGRGPEIRAKRLQEMSKIAEYAGNKRKCFIKWILIMRLKPGIGAI